MAIVTFGLLDSPASSESTRKDKVYLAVPEKEFIKIFNKSNDDATVHVNTPTTSQLMVLSALMIGTTAAIIINSHHLSDVQIFAAALSVVFLLPIALALTIKLTKQIKNFFMSKIRFYEFTQEGYSNTLAHLAKTGRAVHIECTISETQTSKDVLPTREWSFFEAALSDTFNTQYAGTDISLGEVTELLESKLTHGNTDRELKEIVDLYVVHALSHNFTDKELREDAHVAAIRAIDLVVRQIQDKNFQVLSKKNADRESYRAKINPRGIHRELQ